MDLSLRLHSFILGRYKWRVGRFFQKRSWDQTGCSLSPYLYVIVNNALSGMLNQAAADGLFDYHPQCQQVQLTHLTFADDIIVFTDGSVRSLRGS